MYEVNIDSFSGPMDLLLHLIKKEKMDIFDIKLEVIIDDYLNYIHHFEEMNLNIASSYLVMSCELLEIKSRTLLPHDSKNDEEDDPKANLINRLIEYQKYKEQLDFFKVKEEERNAYYTKLPSSILEYQSSSNEIQLNNVSLDDLMKAFQRVLERKELDKPLNTKITKKELSVDDSIKNIKNKFKNRNVISFYDLFEVKTKEYIVVTFLAILEMARHNEIIIKQDSNFNEIICEVRND